MDSTSCCRCCLANASPMKDLNNEIYYVSKFDVEEQAKSEVTVSLTYMQALAMVDIKNLEAPDWQQICRKCENTLIICIEFQQQCMRSLKVLKNIKDEMIVEEYVELEDTKDKLIVDSTMLAVGKSPYRSSLRKKNQNRPKRSKRKSPKVTGDLKALEITIQREYCGSDDGHFAEATDSMYAEDKVHTDTNDLQITKSPESDIVAKFICFHCDEAFVTFSRYSQHREQHNPIKIFGAIKRICNLCQMSTEAYVQHLQEKHCDYQPQECLQCEATFLHQYDLRDHLIKHVGTMDYECKACSNRFNHPKSLASHIRTHSSENKYYCPACGESTKRILDLIHHRDVVHAGDHAVSTLFPCYRCKRVFCKKWTFEAHKCNNFTEDCVAGDVHFQCVECNEKFTDKEQLCCHSIICTNEKNYITCTTCNIQFNTRRSYRSHQKSRHKPKDFICEICSQAFSLRKYLKAHASSHSDNKPEMCPVCLKFFKTKFQLQNHKKIHEERLFECAKCSKRFPSKDILKVHLFKHYKSMSRESCDQCGKIFMGVSQLRLHMRVHTGDKNYNCVTCNKFYYTMGALKYHNEKVHLAKRYECKFCNKSFAAIKSIHEHAFTHKDYMPFNCTDCHRKFTRKDAFKKHLKDHNIVYDEDVHGYHGESFRELIMFVLKNPDNMEFVDVEEAVKEEVVVTSERKGEETAKVNDSSFVTFT